MTLSKLSSQLCVCVCVNRTNPVSRACNPCVSLSLSLSLRSEVSYPLFWVGFTRPPNRTLLSNASKGEVKLILMSLPKLKKKKINNEKTTYDIVNRQAPETRQRNGSSYVVTKCNTHRVHSEKLPLLSGFSELARFVYALTLKWPSKHSCATRPPPRQLRGHMIDD